MTMEELERFRSILQERQANVNEWLSAGPQVGVAELNKVRDLLADIQRSLHQIKDQTYGHCEACGDPVEMHLLEVQPIAHVCIACFTDEEKQMLEEELSIASRIHRALLPQKIEAIDGFELAVKALAARAVGGDYFDFLWNDSGTRVKIVIADSMGKGIPAGLMMSNLQGALRVLAQEIDSPGRLVSRLNHWLCRNLPVTKFVSLACVDLPIGSSPVSQGLAANAGHCPAIIVRKDNSIDCIAPTGTVLGVHEDFGYYEKEIQMSRGDLLALYTDGITEATNAFEEMFEAERLTELLQNNRALPLADISERILAEIQRFSGRATLEDDLTLILLRKT